MIDLVPGLGNDLMLSSSHCMLFTCMPGTDGVVQRWMDRYRRMNSKPTCTADQRFCCLLLGSFVSARES